MTAAEFYRQTVRRRLGGPPCVPFPAIATPDGVRFLALSPSVLRRNPGPIIIPCDPAVRAELLAPLPSADET